MTDENVTFLNSPDEWTTKDNGAPILHAFAGYKTGLTRNSICMLRLRYALKEEHIDIPHALQLGMTADQAEELAQQLLAMAAQARRARPSA